MPSKKGFFKPFRLTVLSAALMAIIISPVVEAATESRHGDIPLMQVEEVTDLIMSPGCKYVYTLTLCPSEEAKQMREIVKDKLIAGESKEDILFYFKEIYGPRVLAQPAKEGFYFVAWWFPYFLLFDVFLVVGVILVIWRRRTATAAGGAGGPGETPQPDSTEQLPDIGDIIEEEVTRFRNE